jgi:hypothetical protein
MFANSVVALMTASILTAQTPAPASLPAPPNAQSTPVPVQTPTSAVSGTITVPVGTSVPLTLMTPIKSKATKPGDSVRAVVAFPVTVGSQLAIPAGSYVEGMVTQLKAKPLTNQQPSLTVHFTRLLFANGYAVDLNGENTQTRLLPESDRTSTREMAELTPPLLPGTNFVMGEGQYGPPPPPTLPPLPQVGPSKAVVIGSTLGGFAAFTIGMLVWAHHRANSYDYVVFDSGWQFQMVLDSPLTLDAARVTAAASSSSSGD